MDVAGEAGTTPFADASARLRRALDALESAVAARMATARAPASDAGDAAVLRAEIERLTAENARLRAARDRDEALRDEAIERVDTAIAALREALGEAPGAA